MKKNKDIKVLMLTENFFPVDVRPRNEANALTKAGYKVSIIALRSKGEKVRENVNGVQTYRIPEISLFEKNYKSDSSFYRKLFNNFKSVIGYLCEYLYFTTASFLVSLYILITKGIDVIHAHNPPDTLFVIGGFYKLFGKKYVFDHHDLSPELFLTKYQNKKYFIYKLLILCEKYSCKLADIVISSNETYKEIETKRHNIDPKRIFIVRNNPIISECVFKKVYTENIKKDKMVLLFLGSINPQDGLDVLLQILHYLVYDLNKTDFICNIVGDGDSLELCKNIAGELNIMDFVDFKGPIFERERVKEYLYISDICVEPAPENELNNHSTFIKIMEYMATSKPIVAFDLKETRYSAGESAILIPPGDIKGFTHAIKKLLDEPLLRKKLGEAGSDRIRKELNWDNASLNLIEAYKTLSGVST